MPVVDEKLAQAFVCPKSDHQGASVARLVLSSAHAARPFEIQAHRYAFASCTTCGYTEAFDLAVLEGSDDLGTLLEVLFLN
jgi:predicted nucleic-acid-binding Zn-ribbon protein